MAQLDFKGRVAVVTGAGSGMGREHATTLASRGARVVVNDLASDRAAEVARAITDAGGEAVANDSDIINASADLVQTAVDAFGGIDILINNAGIVRFGRFWEHAPDEWWNVFDTHIRGTVETTRNAWPHLMASGTGRVVNISSSGMLGAVNVSSYSAGKAAMWGFSNALAIEGKAVGVQVTCVQPSAWTPMTDGSFDHPEVRRAMRETMPASAVAAFVTWLAHQDTKVSGECFQTSGNSAGRTAFAVLPRLRVPESTPENWAQAAGDLMRDGDSWTPFRSTSDSFRAELVFADESLDAVLPKGVAEVEK
ncbi:MAG: SDR family NAD(P)-dependent oxidoreductase [Thermoleophilia bacterium]